MAKCPVNTLYLPPLGGKLSVQKPADQPPVMIIRQNDRSSNFRLSQRCGQDLMLLECPVLPKDEGTNQ